MRRRVPGESAGPNGAEIDDLVARDLTGDRGMSVCAPGPLHRPAHLAFGSKGEARGGAARRQSSCGGHDGSSRLDRRYEGDTVARVARCGSIEISSILRWALADLAVALLEIERQPALSSHETKSAGGPGRRLPVSN